MLVILEARGTNTILQIREITRDDIVKLMRQSMSFLPIRFEIYPILERLQMLTKKYFKNRKTTKNFCPQNSFSRNRHILE